MKAKERLLARRLRIKGWSVRAIAAHIGCSKGSVSTWVRDIALSPEQIQQLKSNQDRARAVAANHPNSPKNKWQRIRDGVIDISSREIKGACTDEELKRIGTALYWAEGYNASRNSVIFANTDPAMIRLMMGFFRKICKVPVDKFRGKVNIHPHLEVGSAEEYWSRISGIPLTQFYKALLAVSMASKGKKDTLPKGTFQIIINDVITCSRIKGWINGIKRWGG